MGFCFVHAADLHLGSPLRGLSLKDARLAAAVEAASRAAFARLIDETIERGASFLIIAGDVFDRDWKDYASGLEFLRELGRATRKGIAVYLLRGNHDAEGQVTRHLTLPEGVREFSTRRAETLFHASLPVALHGRGFPERALTENIVPDYPDAVPGRFNIGVLHTSLDGREGHADYAPCTPADLVAKRYDYWALGHVHAYEEVLSDPPAIYPGVLQGRGVRETGAKGAVCVTVDDSLRIVGRERVIVDRVRFARLDIDFGGGGEEALFAAIEDGVAAEGRAAEGRLLGLRLVISGADASLDALVADQERLAAEVAARADRRGVDMVLEKLVVSYRPRPSAVAPRGEEVIADPAALLDEILSDPDTARRLLAGLGPLFTKLPAEVKAEAGLPEGEADILREARDLVLARLGSGA